MSAQVPGATSWFLCSRGLLAWNQPRIPKDGKSTGGQRETPSLKCLSSGWAWSERCRGGIQIWNLPMEELSSFGWECPSGDPEMKSLREQSKRSSWLLAEASLIWLTELKHSGISLGTWLGLSEARSQRAAPCLPGKSTRTWKEPSTALQELHKGMGYRIKGQQSNLRRSNEATNCDLGRIKRKRKQTAHTVAGTVLSVSYPFSRWIRMTLLWARPYYLCVGKRGMRLGVVSNQDKLAGGRTRLILRDDPTGKLALSTQLPYLIRNESSSAHPDLPNNGYVS